jgi:hypothetical protein
MCLLKKLKFKKNWQKSKAMAKTIFNYKIMRAEIFLQYGIELDETSASILFILQENQNKHFYEQRNKLSIAIEKINSSNRTLALDYNHPRWQSFWFGMGQWGLALFIAIIFAASFYSYYLYDSKQKEKLPAVFNWYKLYYEKSRAESKTDLVNFLKNNPNPE